MGTLKTVEQGATLILQYSGELTLQASAAFKEDLNEILTAREFDHLVVDMSAIPFIDSSGIGMLVSLNTRLKSLGKSLFLLNPATQAQKTLELVQLGDFFHILHDEDDLLTLD